MTEAQRRFADALEDEIQNGTSRWYCLSFADDTGCLGCAIVNALGPTDALYTTTRLHINPGGGEVLVGTIPEDDPPPKEWINRLLRKDDMVRLGMNPVRIPAGTALDEIADIAATPPR